MSDQSDKSMWDFVKSKTPEHPLAKFVGAAVAGLQHEFSPVDGLRKVLGLSESVPAASVIAMAQGRIVLLNAVANVLGVTVDNPGFFDQVETMKALAKITTDSMSRAADLRSR